jgi:hypothetical protein
LQISFQNKCNDPIMVVISANEIITRNHNIGPRFYLHNGVQKVRNSVSQQIYTQRHLRARLTCIPSDVVHT